MEDTALRQSYPVPMKQVEINGGFWGEKLKVNRETTLEIEYRQLKQTGRIDAWKLQWKEGDKNKPHVFWDSDVAKWIEAAAYSLISFPDIELERKVDEVIELICNAQQEDGYLNSYFSSVEPDKRWSNIRDHHELYCAGHLMEAAVAYYEATGKQVLLNALCKYADYIDSVFGEEDGKIHGYCGHEEIELGLVKLYHTTKNRKYLKLSKYFIDARGQEPNFFNLEKEKRKGPLANDIFGLDYYQAHIPVKQQTTADGHAVRACYLYSGMTDIAIETGDIELLQVCKTIWNNITQKRMYIHGGIGSAQSGECFTLDYDLPNESAYAETCAAISFVFFTHRLLQADLDSKYADIIEKTLYNGIISGVSLDGKKFFYANYLASYPGSHKFMKQLSPARQEWFGCACCPPNLARLLASLGGYIYTQNNDKVFIHLYISGTASLKINNCDVAIKQKTDYPWNGDIEITLQTGKSAPFTLGLRIPEWCEYPSLRVNNQAVNIKENTQKGYICINRQWEDGDVINLNLEMKPLLIEAHPSVRHDCGRAAIQRGPIIYCLEEIDNGKDLNDIRIQPERELLVISGAGIFENIPLVSCQATRSSKEIWAGKLYRAAEKNEQKKIINIKAVPYFMWANRGEGEMIVWIRK